MRTGAEIEHNPAGPRTREYRNPWAWVPSLYLAEGIPYVVAMTISVVLYKRLGISNTDIALYTSWLYLPWVIKPFWSPFVDMFARKRTWILAAQILIGASFACIALTIPAGRFFQFTMAFFWLMAFSSATHDIAADGFYMLGMGQDLQAAFVGVRTLFYRIATLAAQGGISRFNNNKAAPKLVFSSRMEGVNWKESSFPGPSGFAVRLFTRSVRLLSSAFVPLITNNSSPPAINT